MLAALLAGDPGPSCHKMQRNSAHVGLALLPVLLHELLRASWFLG